MTHFALKIKFALPLSGDIQLNQGPTYDVCFVCKQTLNKKSIRCTKRDLRTPKNATTRSYLIVIYIVALQDERIYHSIMFIFVMTIVAI